MRFLLTFFAISAVTLHAVAGDAVTVTPRRPAGFERLLAIIQAQAATITSQTATIEQLQAALDARETCEAAGLLYIAGHASADASGCVDPASL